MLYAMSSSRYYPADVFADLNVQRSSGGRSVLVSGHVMGSTLCVGEIDHAERGEVLNVRMRYRLICPNQHGGDFSVEIPISGAIRRVTYGDEGTVLELR